MGEKKRPERERERYRRRERGFLTEGGSGYSILPLELTATHTISQAVNEPTDSQSGIREEGRRHHMTAVVDERQKTLALNTPLS